MKNSTPRHFLLMGLPSTGKTTFLAALWYAVQQRTTPTALILEKLNGDSAYLNRIRSAWLSYQPVGRNPTDTETFVSMLLKSRSGDAEVHLTFPDVSGESFKQQWTDRQMTQSYQSCIQSANGGILFLHPSQVKSSPLISEVSDLAAIIDPEIPQVQTPLTLPASAAPWNIEESPTQVQVVELLQILSREVQSSIPFRMIVAVSAWDLVDPSLSPQEWVMRQLPLLGQFLSSNTENFTVTFYGISAQGGNYDGADVARIQNVNPAKRIRIVGEGVTDPHDITQPLLWLMR
jgi:hypothetical protein